MTLRCDVGHGGVGHSSVPLRLAIPADAFWTVGAGARPAQRASSRLRRSIALRRSPNDAESHAANVRRWNSSSSRLSSWRRVSPVVPPSRTAPGQRRYRQASRLASKLSASCVDRTPHATRLAQSHRSNICCSNSSSASGPISATSRIHSQPHRDRASGGLWSSAAAGRTIGDEEAKARVGL